MKSLRKLFNIVDNKKFKNLLFMNKDYNKEIVFRIKKPTITTYLKFIFIIFELFSLKYFAMNKSSFISNLPENIFNNPIIFKFAKQNLINEIYKKLRKNLFNINLIYISGSLRFGNFLIAINNAIIVCELLGCKKIIIQNNNKLFINHKILYPKYKITLYPNYNFRSKYSLIFNVGYLYNLKFKGIGNVNRFNILKEEILNNLPRLKTNSDDLCIYIRSGDIFYKINNYTIYYVQPPLCFYENILNKFKFRLVKIISENNLNPVIPILLKKYSIIEFKKQDLKHDIAYLANSFNIVSAKSSFVLSIIKLNDKIKFLWEYDFYPLSEKYLHLHPSVYTFPYNYTIYKMDSSLTYKKLMYPWINSKKQREMMMKEKCVNHFSIIKPRI